MALNKEQYDILTEWIRENLIRIRTYNQNDDTGVIRTCFEQSPMGFYLDNDTLNQVMQNCGYIPKSLGNNPYMAYTISRNSPAFIRYFGRDR